MYKYLLEDLTTDISLHDLSNVTHIDVVCYHIDSKSAKYPFLQFLVYNNVLENVLQLPSISDMVITDMDTSNDLVEVLIDKIKYALESLGCDSTSVDDTIYKKTLYSEDLDTLFVFANISNIDISGIHFGERNRYWFVLPSEIINHGSTLGKSFTSSLITLFTEEVNMGLLYDAETNTNYMLPDVAYVGGEIKTVEFNSVFGNVAKQIYNNCGSYFYFHRDMQNAMRDGIWVNPCHNFSDSKELRIGTRLIAKDGKYLQGGINRYAVFVEGNIYLEKTSTCLLTDEMIANDYVEPCIIIGYCKENNVKHDLLVKQYENFVCISHHLLKMPFTKLDLNLNLNLEDVLLMG